METFEVKPTGYTRRRFSPTVRSDDDGAHHQRLRGNVNLRGWKLDFQDVTWEEVIAIEDFFELVRGTPFQMANPENGTEIVYVQILTDELVSNYLNYRKANAQLEVQEVIL